MEANIDPHAALIDFSSVRHQVVQWCNHIKVNENEIAIAIIFHFTFSYFECLCSARSKSTWKQMKWTVPRMKLKSDLFKLCKKKSFYGIVVLLKWQILIFMSLHLTSISFLKHYRTENFHIDVTSSINFCFEYFFCVFLSFWYLNPRIHLYEKRSCFEVKCVITNLCRVCVCWFGVWVWVSSDVIVPYKPCVSCFVLFAVFA